MTATLVRFEASSARMSDTGTASISTIVLSRIIEGSKAGMAQCVALVPLVRQLAFADVTMSSGTSFTLIHTYIKLYQPPLVAVASFREATSPSA
jgi:hypothetical protein